MLDSNGRAASTRVEGLPVPAFLQEDAAGRIWLSTYRGLLQLAVEDSPQGPALRQAALYEKGIPCGRCYGMWIDARQNLWWLGLGPNNRLLYRFALPRYFSPVSFRQNAL